MKTTAIHDASCIQGKPTVPVSFLQTFPHRDKFCFSDEQGYRFYMASYSVRPSGCADVPTLPKAISQWKGFQPWQVQRVGWQKKDESIFMVRVFCAGLRNPVRVLFSIVRL